MRATDKTAKSEQSARHKRRAQVRKAQVQHRQRKANYVKQLESDIAGVREQIEHAERERRTLRVENQAIRAQLTTGHGATATTTTTTTTATPVSSSSSSSASYHYGQPPLMVSDDAHSGFYTIASTSMAAFSSSYAADDAWLLQQQQQQQEEEEDLVFDLGDAVLDQYFSLGSDVLQAGGAYTYDSSSPAAYPGSSRASSGMYGSPGPFVDSSGNNTPYPTLSEMHGAPDQPGQVMDFLFR